MPLTGHHSTAPGLFFQIKQTVYNVTLKPLQADSGQSPDETPQERSRRHRGLSASGKNMTVMRNGAMKANPLTKRQQFQRKLGWRIHDLTSPIFSWVHHRLYYSREGYPDQNRGKFLNGLSELCWCYVCGDSFLFSIHIGNIYWQSPLIERIIERLGFRFTKTTPPE